MDWLTINLRKPLMALAVFLMWRHVFVPGGLSFAYGERINNNGGVEGLSAVVGETSNRIFTSVLRETREPVMQSYNNMIAPSGRIVTPVNSGAGTQPAPR